VTTKPEVQRQYSKDDGAHVSLVHKVYSFGNLWRNTLWLFEHGTWSKC